MKRIYQYLRLTALSGLACLFMAVSADAQRGGGHGGGGGRSGGGGGSFSRGGFSGGGSISRGGGSSFGGGSRTFSTPSSGSFSRGRSNSAFSAPAPSQRGFEHSRGYNSPPTFQRGGVGSSYRGGVSSFRGGYTRGGRYYPGGYNGRSFGYRYSPWSSRGGYYYNRGFYSSYYYPRLGFSLGILPYGYYPFWWGDAQFYYSSGYFYQYDNNQYTVVEPPIGAAINSLPSNAQAININGTQYYEANGVYYLPVTKDDGSLVYQVAGKDGQLDTYSSPQNGYAPQNDGYGGRQEMAPQQNDQPAVAMPEIGDIFYSLPSDSRKIRLNGEIYYVSPDDFYYQEIRDANGKKAYKVTGTPDDNPGN